MKNHEKEKMDKILNLLLLAQQNGKHKQNDKERLNERYEKTFLGQIMSVYIRSVGQIIVQLTAYTSCYTDTLNM